MESYCWRIIGAFAVLVGMLAFATLRVERSEKAEQYGARCLPSADARAGHIPNPCAFPSMSSANPTFAASQPRN